MANEQNDPLTEMTAAVRRLTADLILRMAADIKAKAAEIGMPMDGMDAVAFAIAYCAKDLLDAHGGDPMEVTQRLTDVVLERAKELTATLSN